MSNKDENIEHLKNTFGGWEEFISRACQTIKPYIIYSLCFNLSTMQHDKHRWYFNENESGNHKCMRVWTRRMSRCNMNPGKAWRNMRNNGVVLEGKIFVCYSSVNFVPFGWYFPASIPICIPISPTLCKPRWRGKWRKLCIQRSLHIFQWSNPPHTVHNDV